ncbi:hypothetical protein [Nocardioides sp. YIM 152315]|uniref:hypothetical protein n=1 Tax=Nocardioides sp. YIM 152315 TaxID=3031760 RepID=UPI0023DC2A29|nr:hypothetical protein [Nocardioides sp. YIM 152315]MDF1606292.1 hypothetical protein [Nocardioides sp. YIM 152315]
MTNRMIALTTAGALVAGSAALLAAPVAQADGPERHAHGRVAGATYEIAVEKERRFEVDADIDGVPAGSTWRLVVVHDGERVGARTAAAVRDDGRWEVDFREVRSRNTAGPDRFKVTLTRVGGPGKVTRKLAFPR